jgi:hypothetical protein
LKLTATTDWALLTWLRSQAFIPTLTAWNERRKLSPHSFLRISYDKTEEIFSISCMNPSHESKFVRKKKK